MCFCSDLINVYQIILQVHKRRKKACILKHACNMPSCRIVFPVTTSGLILWTDGFRKKENLQSTFTLTPPQQFFQRSHAIIPQSNFWYDSGTVSEITVHIETNFFLVTRQIPIYQWSVWAWRLFRNAHLQTIYHPSSEMVYLLNKHRYNSFTAWVW